jgi:hypothetical protein
LEASCSADALGVRLATRLADQMTDTFESTSMASSKKTKSKSPLEGYVPTPDELAVLKAHFARKKARKSIPRFRVSKSDGKTSISPDHPSDLVASVLLMDALGIEDPQFLDGLLTQLANVVSRGQEVSAADLNFVLSVIKGIEPRDQLEAMLAAQMAAVHLATMTFARRLANVETIPQQDSSERALNKLARTFAAQMETLKRYRTGGQQKVTVEHVTVNKGGQAIVGNVQQAAAPLKPAQNETATTPALSDQSGTVFEMDAKPEPVKKRAKR